MPETAQRTLEQELSTESEYEVNQQLADDEDRDNKLLPGAPEPNVILPIPEPNVQMIPFPYTQHQHKLHIPIAQFLDQQAILPFLTSKPTLKLQTPTAATPPQIPFIPMASVPAPSTFKGKETENPQNFLWEVERYIYLNRITDKVMKVVIFSTFIYAGSQADIWWNGLATSKKTTWVDVKK
jgi:hypothetical protein